MKANELMIGDWVRVNRDGLCIKKDTIVQVRGIDGDDKIEEKGLFGAAHCRPLDEDQFDGGIWLDYLDPIPLTPEILKKNGFSFPMLESWWRVVDCNPTIYLAEHNESWWLYQDDYLDSRQYFAKIKYVHELQHALRLCGIEKEIVL